MTIIQEKKQHRVSMKKAAVESILVWLLTFTGFITMFFFAIDYGNVLRANDTMEAITDYAVNRVANGSVLNDIVTDLNKMLPANINPIAPGAINCNSVLDVPPTFQVIFTTTTTNSEFLFYEKPIQVKRVVYNEVDGQTVTCTLSITLTE